MLIDNSSLENGVFPDIWNLARVSPIYKSGPTTELNNYGPISVISVFSRLLDRLAHDELFEFLKTNESMTCNQAAFRSHSDWMRVNKLSPNPKKTEFMIVGHPLKN